MKKINLGQAINTLANIGVIAGIVFLALELRQNNELAEAQQEFNRLSVAAEGGTIIAQSPSLANAIAKPLAEMTPGERIQVQSWAARLFLIMEWSFRELPRGELAVYQWRAMMESPNIRSTWEATKAGLDDRFVEFVERDVLSVPLE